MIKHNLVIAYRSFLRDKSSFLINLLGLSSGLACALLIFLWVRDEMQMDKFHEKDAQLYQVMQRYNTPAGVKVVDWSPGPLAEALKAETPEVEYAARAKMGVGFYDGILTYGEKHLRAAPIYVQEEYLDVFSYPLLHGDKSRALTDKYAVLISEEMALKLFSSTEEAVGKTIEWTKKFGDIVDFSGVFTITGVFKDIPPNSTTKFDVIFPFEFYKEKNPGVMLWSNDQAAAFLILKKGADIEALDKKITALVQSNRENQNAFFLKKYSSSYLYGKYENGLEAGGRIEYVWLFSVIAFLILIIAAINFMNLSTAKASMRIKEIGVKKTLGANRKNLLFQFVSEYALLSLIALLLAGVLISLFLPQFNQITGKRLALSMHLDLLLSFLAIGLGTGLISSIYPALYLSGFKPAQVLKGKLKASFGETWIRKGLVVFQFAVSVVLMVSVLVIYRQMNFVHHKNLGYDRDNIIRIKNEGPLEEKIETFLAELKKIPQVVNAANSNIKLIGSENFTSGIRWKEQEPDERMLINVFTTNYDFLETYGIKIKEGRSFSRVYGTDTLKVVLNEAAVNGMGLKNPVGQIINFWGEDVEIVGITEDFQYQSLYHEVQPCIFRLFRASDNYGYEIWVKIQAGKNKEAIDKIASLYETFNPGFEFEFRFLDEEYQAMYESENRIAALSKYFALLAIIISCLGLFGLAAFTAERRTKEIGIRKVLGSSVWGVVRLLSTDFIKMVLIAIVIALPLSFLIARRWLEDFAYKIDLQWTFFAGAAVLTLLIAWLTVVFQTLKAARVNPVLCLKEE